MKISGNTLVSFKTYLKSATLGVIASCIPKLLTVFNKSNLLFISYLGTE